MPRKETDKPSLLDVLAAAGQEDLDQVRGRIGTLKKELAGLEQAEKLLSYRLNGKPAKKSKTPGEPGAGDGSSLKEQIYEVLSKRGKATPKQIGELLNCPATGIGRSLSSCEWFTKLDSGEWTIAKAGDRQAAK